jgi:hypothetical protein
MKTSAIGCSLLLLSFYGCSPLQQAPLVYSSKVTIGVDVSATSTETPGAGINIGYKQVDAAYVPVAVAKKCEVENQEKCQGDLYKVIPLNGNNNVEDGKVPTEAELANKSDTVARTTDILKQKQDTITQLTATYDRNRKLADTVATLTKKSQDLANDPNASDLEKNASSVALSSAQAAKASLTADADNLSNAKLERDKAANAAANAAEIYQNALTAVNGRNQNAKQDAYSVFGTFNADSSTSVGVQQRAVAGLKLGKIFSTGVASQSLTEGMKLYYASMAPGACLDKAVKLVAYLPESERAAIVTKFVALCDTTSPEPK